MHTSRLWRDVVSELGAASYPEVQLDHALTSVLDKCVSCQCGTVSRILLSAASCGDQGVADRRVECPSVYARARRTLRYLTQELQRRDLILIGDRGPHPRQEIGAPRLQR